MSLSPAQIQQFKIDGYLVLPNALNNTELTALNTLSLAHVTDRINSNSLLNGLTLQEPSNKY